MVLEWVKYVFKRSLRKLLKNLYNRKMRSFRKLVLKRCFFHSKSNFKNYVIFKDKACLGVLWDLLGWFSYTWKTVSFSRVSLTGGCSLYSISRSNLECQIKSIKACILYRGCIWFIAGGISISRQGGRGQMYIHKPAGWGYDQVVGSACIVSVEPI